MKKPNTLRSRIISVQVIFLILGTAIILSLGSILFLNRHMSDSMAQFRNAILLQSALRLEDKINEHETISDQLLINLTDRFRHPPGGPDHAPPPEVLMGGPPPGLPDDHGPGHGPGHGPERGPHPGPGGPPGFNSQLWIVNQNREVLAAKTPGSKIPDFSTLQFPENAHEVIANGDFFRFKNETVIIRMDTSPVTYLVVLDEHRPSLKSALQTYAWLSFVTVCIALLSSVILTYFYLKRKSDEARVVISRLEQGDLSARFQIKRFDEFSGLIVDFNRMAHEIEKLVNRIQNVENTRKSLLQEIGHDLRTPLTSLRTAAEMLRDHDQKLSAVDRNELLGTLNAEVIYFASLIESLMTIASLEDPHYKKTAERVDVNALIDQEVKSFRATCEREIRWVFTPSAQDANLLGEPRLLQRMIRNALSNAAKFTRNEVSVKISVLKDHAPSSQVKITITDNGPGFDPETLESFGARKEFRARNAASGESFSLGLGSVILKSVAELHGGSVQVKNLMQGEQIAGASVEFLFPASGA